MVIYVSLISHRTRATGQEPWNRGHGARATGQEPQDRNHGAGAMGQGPRDRSHGTGTMGQEPQGRSHGAGHRPRLHMQTQGQESWALEASLALLLLEVLISIQWEDSLK